MQDFEILFVKFSVLVVALKFFRQNFPMAKNNKTMRVGKHAYFIKQIEICMKKFRKIHQKFQISNLKNPPKLQFLTFFIFFFCKIITAMLSIDIKKTELT